MYTLILIFAVLAFVSLFFAIKREVSQEEKTIKNCKKNKRKSPYAIWLIACVAMGAVLVAIPLVWQSVLIGDAQVVANFEGNRLFQDVDENYYFTIEMGNWDVTSVQSKNIVSEEDALSIIEKAKQYEQIKNELIEFYRQ